MGVPRYWRNIPKYYNLDGSKGRKGSVVTYTVLRTSLSDPSKENVDVTVSEVPLVLAIIELDNGKRLTAQVVDCEPEDVKMGSKVEPVFRKIMEKGEKGIIEYGYKFRLAD